jgi:hypothetical protein
MDIFKITMRNIMDNLLTLGDPNLALLPIVAPAQ